MEALDSEATCCKSEFVSTWEKLNFNFNEIELFSDKADNSYYAMTY